MADPADNHETLSKNEERTLEYGELLRLQSGESDRGLAITVAAHAETYLERILRAFLIPGNAANDLFDGPFAPFGSLSGKIKAAHVLGLITPDEANRVDAIRKVRNVFAHEMSASFEHEAVRKLCRKPPIEDGRMSDRDAFLHMAMNTAIHLIYRDIGVARHLRRTPLTTVERDRLDGSAPVTG